jgi:hypothetical protein
VIVRPGLHGRGGGVEGVVHEPASSKCRTARSPSTSRAGRS